MPVVLKLHVATPLDVVLIYQGRRTLIRFDAIIFLFIHKYVLNAKSSQILQQHASRIQLHLMQNCNISLATGRLNTWHNFDLNWRGTNKGCGSQ